MKAKEYKFKVPIYDKTIYVYVGNEIEDSIDLINKTYSLNQERDYSEAGVMTVHKDSEFRIIAFFKKEPSINYIVHESIHIAMEVLDYIGHRPTVSDDEPLAYLVEFIFLELRKILKV